MDKTALALIVLLMLIAFFLVPSAFGMPVLDPGSGGGARRTPTPTPTPIFEVNPWDLNAVQRCLKFSNVMRVIMQDEGWRIDPAIVFGVMAQESMGFVNPSKTLGWPLDRVGSRGLMQVAPFVWRVDNPDKLLDPRLNIWWGVRILNYSLEFSEGDMEMALAIYNCGQDGEAKGCGHDYARKVIYHWAPLFREAFIDGRWRNKLYWNREDERLIEDWLMSFGYNSSKEIKK